MMSHDVTWHVQELLGNESIKRDVNMADNEGNTGIAFKWFCLMCGINYWAYSSSTNRV